MAEIISAKHLFMKRRWKDPLSLITRVFTNCVCRDRFCVLNETSKLKIYNELGDTEDLLLDWKLADDIDINREINDRASEIIANNKDVAVLWSGGVDSTLVACALLQNGIDPKNLHIICGTKSKEEYPWFYEFLHKKEIDIIEDDDVMNSVAEVDMPVVSGWCADQLFGSIIHLRNPELFNKPWFDAYLSDLSTSKQITLEDEKAESVKEAVHAYAEKLGLNIEQYCEFAWLFNFGIKWTHVAEVTKMTARDDSIRNRMISFFDTLDFQLWSLQNYKNIRNANTVTQPQHYKKPLKQYIYDYTNDPSYWKNKGKNGSWKMTRQNDFAVCVKDTDGYHNYAMSSIPKREDAVHLNKKVLELYKK